MKTVDKQVAATFGIVAGGVLLIGLAALATATARAGSLAEIFAQPEEELGLATTGVVGCCLAAAYGVIVLIFGWMHRRHVRRMEELSRFCVRVRGQVVGLREDMPVRLGRQRPVFAAVECTLPDGRAVILRSHRIWRRDVQTGMHVDVFFDPADDANYVIDLPQG